MYASISRAQRQNSKVVIRSALEEEGLTLIYSSILVGLAGQNQL
jgi:hypothetical protein